MGEIICSHRSVLVIRQPDYELVEVSLSISLTIQGNVYCLKYKPDLNGMILFTKLCLYYDYHCINSIVNKIHMDDIRTKKTPNMKKSSRKAPTW